MMTSIIILLSAAISIASVLYTGRHNPSVLLMAMFCIWVSSPFAALWWIGFASQARALALLVSLGPAAFYAYIALGPPRPRTAAPFLIAPLVCWIVLGCLLPLKRHRHTKS